MDEFRPTVYLGQIDKVVDLRCLHLAERLIKDYKPDHYDGVLIDELAGVIQDAIIAWMAANRIHQCVAGGRAPALPLPGVQTPR